MTDYRLAPGTLTAAALTTAYALENFPVQSDQFSNLVIPWQMLDDNGTTFPRAARYVTLMDGSQRADGKIQFEWKWFFLSQQMVVYLESTFLGGIYESALVTVRTRLHTGAFQVFHATLLKPVPNDHLKKGDRGIQDYLFRFVGCRVAS